MAVAVIKATTVVVETPEEPVKSIFGIAVAALSAAALVAGCSSSQTETASTTSGSASSTPAAITGDVTVFAAASLKSTFTELGEQFKKDNPGTTVTFNFAGSSDLVTQLTQGAPADVFASADTANMTKAIDAGLVAGDPVNFATNTLTIVTPPGNPKGIASFADLAKPGTTGGGVRAAGSLRFGDRRRSKTATGVHADPGQRGVRGHRRARQGHLRAGRRGLVYVTDAAGAGDKVTACRSPSPAAR